MSAILALDASTEACSVALLVEGQVYEDFRLVPRQHAQLLLPMVEQLLQQAKLKLTDLDALAYGCGPGAFTGIRIAAGVAQGLALGVDKPLLAISTLEALALAAKRQRQAQQVLVAIDARMDEVYWQLFDCRAALPSALNEAQVTPPEQVTGPSEAFGWGSGWAYRQRFAKELAELKAEQDVYPQAQDIAVLAEAYWQQGVRTLPEQALPVYIRDQVAHQSNKS